MRCVHARARRRRPTLEALEDRLLPAINVPNLVWVEQGPGPLINGQLEGIPDQPVAGAVQAIAQDPIKPDTVFIGSVNGGIWKTTNATGAPPSWTPLTDDFPSLSISSLAFSKADSTFKTLYAGIGASSNFGGESGPLAGLLRSTDEGATWQLVGSELRGHDIRKVVPLGGSSVANETVVVAATDGLFRSTNGGLSFTAVPGMTGFFTDLVLSGSGFLFAARRDTPFPKGAPDPLDGGVFRSTNGLTWTAVNSGGEAVLAAAAENTKLAANGTTVYAGTVLGGQVAGFFRSTTSGGSWATMELPGMDEIPGVDATFIGIHASKQGDTNFSLTVDPNNASIVYVGGDTQPFVGQPLLFPLAGNRTFDGRLFRGDMSKAVGSGQWEPITGNNASFSAPHADSRVLTFDLAGHLLEGDDGGIYRLIHPEGSLNPFDLRRWESMNGDLRITEVESVAIDPVLRFLLAGAQDNASSETQGRVAPVVGAPPPGWTVDPIVRIANNNAFSAPGDGGVQAVDPFSSAPNILRYSIGNNVNFFIRRTVDRSNTQLAPASPVLLTAPGNPLPHSGLIAADQPPITDPSRTDPDLYVLNAVTPGRLLLGFNGLYESFDKGDTITFLDTLPTATTPRVTALAYGGTNPNGTANGGVVYVARGPGLRLRPADGAAFVDVVGGTMPALPDGGSIADLVLDPMNFRTVFVVTSRDHVFRLDNAGLATQSPPVDLTGNLSDLGIQGLATIELVRPAGGPRILLVGTDRGVYRTLDSDSQGTNAHWHAFGTGLPNAPVTDLHFDPSSGILMAATLGRGTWAMATNTLTALTTPEILRISGDTDALNEDDQITLRRDAAKPWLLDVFLNKDTTGTPSLQFPLASVQKIVVNGGGGNDTLTVDSSNGPVLVSEGIDYDGGTGAFTDTLVLTGADGALQPFNYLVTRDAYTVTGVGSGRSAVSFEADVNYDAFGGFDDASHEVDQVVNVTNAETVVDDVPSPGLTVDYSGLTASDTLTLDTGTFRGAVQPRVVSSLFGSVLHANQAQVFVHTARSGNNTVNVQRAPVATTVMLTQGPDTVNVGRTVFSVTQIAGHTVQIPVGDTLTDITAKLTVQGNFDPANSDTVNVNAGSRLSVGQSGVPGQLTDSAITGLGLGPAGISYSGVQNVNINLEADDDSFAVFATASGVNTAVHAGGGDDLITVGSDLNGTTPGTLGNIRGPLSLDGGPESGGDTLYFDDTGDPAALPGTLSATGLSGLGLSAGVTYGAVENLIVLTANGDRHFTVNSFPAGFADVTNNNGSLGILSSGGTATVNAGTLVVGSTLGLPVVVNSGGTLAGTGTVAGLTVNAGGTVSPGLFSAAGSSIGTLTVSGNASFNSGSKFSVQSNGTQTDLLQCSGTITLNSPALSFVPPATGTFFFVMSETGANRVLANGPAFDPATLPARVTAQVTGGGFSVLLVRSPGFQGRSVTTPIDEGQVATVTGTIAQANPEDAFLLEVTWGDGTPTETYTFTPDQGPLDGKAISVSHRYLDDAGLGRPYTIGLLWKNQNDASNTATLDVAVNNVAPTLGALSATAPLLARTATLSGALSDPGPADTFTARVDWGDGSVDTFAYPAGTTAFRQDHLYRHEGTFPIHVIVTDDDGGSTTATTSVTVAPASPNERYVAQLYRDLLGREADAPGLQFWSGQLDEGGSRTAVVRGMEASVEYRTDLVQGLYQALLHRAAEPAGLGAWVGALAAGATQDDLRAAILSSPEYFAGCGGGTAAGFLAALYRDALGRDVDPTGLAVFTAGLARGMTRADVVTALFRSAEYQQDLVEGLYHTYLRRDADPDGLAGWLAVVRNGGREEDLLAAFAGSDEYAARL
jgi:Domain of unknown function (DUF4214)/PKD domain